MRVEKLAKVYRIVPKYVHFPLHPDTPVEGRTLEDLFGSGPDAIAAKNAQMKALMEAEGLPYGTRTHTYNSRLAQELGVWAETQPGGEAIHDTLYKAYFVDNRNLHDTEVLLDLVASVGLSQDEATEVLAQRSFKDAVDADWEKSRRYGVTGVPTFVAGQRGVVGAQSYEVIERLLIEAGVSKR